MPPNSPAEAPVSAAVVLVNLGTPQAPTPAAVRRYLAQFLWDPRVIELPRWKWWPILQAVLLIRPRRSAHAYAQIWTEAGSPLLVHTLALAQRLGAHLRERGASVVVRAAMTYGEPALRHVITELVRSGARRVLVVPLYPQYSASSTGAVVDALADTQKSLRWPPETRSVGDYHDHPAHIEALARSVEAHWRMHGQAQRLLLSFHGIPQRYVDAGDPYLTQCQITAQRLRERLGLAPERMVVAFQSRVGREVWIKPYTEEVMRELPAQGVRTLQVLCPGFAVDCLETLEEIAMRNRADFLAAGGESFQYIPALNASDDHVAMLASLVAQHTPGWAEFTIDTGGSATASSCHERETATARPLDGAA
jgi:ferrochelatase